VAALDQLLVDALQVICLGAARPAPLAPGVQDDGLVGVVLQVDLLALRHEGVPREVGDFLTLLLRVADGGLPTWVDELEGATDRDGVVAGRALPTGGEPAEGGGGGEQRS